MNPQPCKPSSKTLAKLSWLSLTIILTLVFLAGGGLVYLRKAIQKPDGVLIQITQSDRASPSPTLTMSQFPFRELTIPYLRSREYNSQLGNLEVVSQNQVYTSYITSYDSDGLKINGLLTIPKGPIPRSPAQPGEGGVPLRSLGEGGWPAVVFVHGYIPSQEYRTQVNYMSYVDYLVRNGLVVFKIDLRGHDQSEGEPDGSYYSGDYIIDTLHAVAALKTLKDPSTDSINSLQAGSGPIVDADRVGLWGHSMAGNVVFRSFVAMPEIPKVVIWAGAVYTYEDFSQYRISDASYQPPPQDSERRRKRDELFATHGQFSPESEFWKQVPATNYLDEKRGAVQVHHAVDDPVVDLGYSRNLMKILDETDIEHGLFEYPSGGHNLTGSSFTQAMQRTADFFKE